MGFDNVSCATLEKGQVASPDVISSLAVQNQASNVGDCKGKPGAPTRPVGDQSGEISFYDPYKDAATPHSDNGKQLVARQATPEEEAALNKALDQMHAGGGGRLTPEQQQQASEAINHTLGKDQPPYIKPFGNQGDMPDHYDGPLQVNPNNGRIKGFEDIDKKYPTLSEYNKRVHDQVHESEDFNDKARNHWNKMSPKEQELVKKEYDEYNKAKENQARTGTFLSPDSVPMGKHLQKYMEDMKALGEEAHQKAQTQKRQIAKDLEPKFGAEQRQWQQDGGITDNKHF